MDHLIKILPLYLGCDTNKGKFIGMREDILFIQKEEGLIEEYKVQDVGNAVILNLRELSNLTDEQSKQLNKEGLSIGRPHGYTFSNNGFLYLLTLGVDLFGLINSGYAKVIS